MQPGEQIMSHPASHSFQADRIGESVAVLTARGHRQNFDGVLTTAEHTGLAGGALLTEGRLSFVMDGLSSNASLVQYFWGA
jgi:hypothetical protein